MKEIQPQGNYFDKYNDDSTIVKVIMNGFFKNLEYLLSTIQYENVYEAGCGEGYISQHILNYNMAIQRPIKVTASDISEKMIKQAKINFPDIHFDVNSIYHLPERNATFDLVIASEVLEHLAEPENALRELFRISKRYVVISVPNEPIWRMANIARGRYIRSIGNTPGHIQHWTRKDIINLMACFGNVLKVRNPFPWTMILGEKSSRG